MEEQHPKGEVTCPWCKITFEGECCPQCGWAPSMLRCPDCGTFYKGETCPQCEKRREEEEAEKQRKLLEQIKQYRAEELENRQKLLNHLKTVMYCDNHKIYYLGKTCPKCNEQKIEQIAAQSQNEKYINRIKALKLCEKCGSFYVGDHCNFCCEDDKATEKPLLPITYSNICPKCGTLYRGNSCPTCAKKESHAEPKISIEDLIDKKINEAKQSDKNSVAVVTNKPKQDFVTALLFVFDCFFSIALFLLFMLPVMKMNISSELYQSYDLYEFIKVFSNDSVEWSDDAKAVYGCCIAIVVFTCIGVLISVYSIANAITTRKIKPSNVMIFECLIFIVILIIMIGNINSINSSAKYAANSVLDNYGNVIVGDSATVSKDIYKIGAFPIVLLIISIVLLIAHGIVAIHNSSSNGTDSKANTSAT